MHNGDGSSGIHSHKSATATAAAALVAGVESACTRGSNSSSGRCSVAASAAKGGRAHIQEWERGLGSMTKGQRSMNNGWGDGGSRRCSCK